MEKVTVPWSLGLITFSEDQKTADEKIDGAAVDELRAARRWRQRRRKEDGKSNLYYLRIPNNQGLPYNSFCVLCPRGSCILAYI
jgi:hypothetical protein